MQPINQAIQNYCCDLCFVLNGAALMRPAGLAQLNLKWPFHGHILRINTLSCRYLHCLFFPRLGAYLQNVKFFNGTATRTFTTRHCDGATVPIDDL